MFALQKHPPKTLITAPPAGAISIPLFRVCKRCQISLVWRFGGFVLQPVTPACDGYDLCMEQEAVQDGCGGRDLTDQFAQSSSAG